jgi:hypothetical protein
MLRLPYGIAISISALVLIVSYQQCSPARFATNQAGLNVGTEAPSSTSSSSTTTPPSLTDQPPAACLATIQVPKSSDSDCKDKDDDGDKDDKDKVSGSASATVDNDVDKDDDDDDDGDNVQICHVPPGNSAARHTIVISKSAVAAHLSHHDDFVGSCDQQPPTNCP